MKRLILILMVACLLALGGQSFAELCTIDAVPAATLLLPAFQVDIGDANGNGVADCADGTGIDTLFSINNASAAPALAHVTLWTDWTWPSLDFDVFLTGFDMQSVSMCQVIANGRLPITADEQNDPDDVISPNFGWSDDGDFPGCEDFFPFPDPIITGARAERVGNAHAGYPISQLGGDCTGDGINGDGQCEANSPGGGVTCPAGTIARGYVTVDNAFRCSIVFPSDPATVAGNYFNNGDDTNSATIASNQNQLWGDWFLVDRANDFAQGDNLVHIEAADGFDGSSTASGYTFYGRYPTALFNNPNGGADNREPLGGTWGARYLNGGDFTGGTKFTVWRDSTEGFVNPNAGFDCGRCIDGVGAGPFWCPLNERQVVCFDEMEDCVELCGFADDVISPPDPDDPLCFPLESQVTQVGVDPLDPPFEFGWCYLNLNVDVAGAFPGGFGPNQDLAQSYVSVSHDALGRFSVGYSAIELTSSCSDLNPVLVEN